MSLETIEQEVLEAAAEIVAAFGSSKKEKYFSLFSPDATFIFYSSNRRFDSRAEYEAEWNAWEADGFVVHGCASSLQKVTFHASDTVAVFTHTVRTDLTIAGDRMQTGERESIIFEKVGGQWIAIHEHLSLDPTFESK